MGKAHLCTVLLFGILSFVRKKTYFSVSVVFVMEKRRPYDSQFFLPSLETGGIWGWQKVGTPGENHDGTNVRKDLTNSPSMRFG